MASELLTVAGAELLEHIRCLLEQRECYRKALQNISRAEAQRGESGTKEFAQWAKSHARKALGFQMHQALPMPGRNCTKEVMPLPCSITPPGGGSSQPEVVSEDRNRVEKTQ